MRVRFPRLLWIFCIWFLMGCESQTQTDEASVALSTAGKEFASGTKGVKLILSDDSITGSFGTPVLIPTATVIPPGYPGSGSGFYLPGISANPTRYFDLNGTTPVQKPAWISDVQLGITGLPGSAGGCATFGRTANGPFDSDGFYRVSEMDCQAVSGSNLGVPTFIRIILNRDTAFFGTRENLMLQVEYRATGLRPNSDGTLPNPEENLDQLWKVFWGQTLVSSASLTPFSIFIPPNYAHWCRDGSGSFNAANCTVASVGTAAPPTVKQILI
ncbi:MAG: hypothetical protein KGP28_12225, partial [Bdellovibrionales bacterium]|nr:hypothetical protein [Bdellovibrionales bacterium]